MGSSLLRHPSPELSRLISAHGSLSKGERNFQWPVLAFVIQHHDLEGLEVAMRHALRKSACRVFAMEVRRRRRARWAPPPWDVGFDPNPLRVGAHHLVLLS